MKNSRLFPFGHSEFVLARDACWLPQSREGADLGVSQDVLLLMLGWLLGVKRLTASMAKLIALSAVLLRR